MVLKNSFMVLAMCLGLVGLANADMIYKDDNGNSLLLQDSLCSSEILAPTVPEELRPLVRDGVLTMDGEQHKGCYLVRGTEDDGDIAVFIDEDYDQQVVPMNRFVDQLSASKT